MRVCCNRDRLESFVREHERMADEKDELVEAVEVARGKIEALQDFQDTLRDRVSPREPSLSYNSHHLSLPRQLTGSGEPSGAQSKL
jgi:hypothetical protein